MSTYQPITPIILAGGLGTRLLPAVADRPKALAEIAGRPFLAYLLDQLLEADIEHAVLCTGHLHDQIFAAFGTSYSDGALTLSYSREHRPLGTAGAIRHAMHHIDTHHVIVLNGDSFCEVDLNEFSEWAIDEHTRIALVTARCDEVDRFGQLVINSATRIVERFEEKGQSTGSGWINSGIYSFSSALVRSFPADAPLSLEHDVFPEFAGIELMAWPTEGRFIDVGTPRSFAQAQKFFDPERAGLLILDRQGSWNCPKHPAEGCACRKPPAPGDRTEESVAIDTPPKLVPTEAKR